MNWFENNPLGAVLAGVCGLLVLVAGLLAWVWSLPVSVTAAPDAAAGVAADGTVSRPSDLGPLSEYRGVSERPMFSESRRPPVIGAEAAGLADDEAEVAGQPQVRLTGVVITPALRMVTLTPLAEGETFIAHEGVPLEGEYQGWTVSDIQPRSVTLASLDGSSLALDLIVNERKIAEPPKPPPPPSAEEEDEDEEVVEDRPLSRAEEIRQRIQERREELRRAQQEETEEGSRDAYRDAIQNMIRAGSSGREAPDDEDEDDD